jgi:tRNA (cmo5U34)-methyltransferase
METEARASPRAARQWHGAGVKPSDTAQPFRDRDAAEARDALLAPLAPLTAALHLSMRAALAPLRPDARVLMVGVGTGPELLALAAAHPGWRFTALDPAEAMLDVCRRRAEAAGVADRCNFHCGYLATLPDAPAFDAATALTVSHFFHDAAARVGFFQEIAARLAPGGLLVNSDLAGDRAAPEHPERVAQWAALLQAHLPTQVAEGMVGALATAVNLQPPEVVATMLMRAGFARPVQFYQVVLLHAWWARRA